MLVIAPWLAGFAGHGAAWTAWVSGFVVLADSGRLPLATSEVAPPAGRIPYHPVLQRFPSHLQAPITWTRLVD
jgi:hypothetical protein